LEPYSNYIHNCKNKTRNKKNFFHSLPSFKFNLSPTNSLNTNITNPSTNSSNNTSLSSNNSTNQNGLISANKLKPFNDLSSASQKNRRLKEAGKEIYYNAKGILQHSNIISFNLKKITLEIDNIDYEIDFMDANVMDTNLKQDAVIRSCDEAMITRDAYRSLSKNYPELERCYKIEYRHQIIQRIINDLVPINIFNINDNNENNDAEDVIVNFNKENINAGDGAFRSITHVLNIIVPLLKSSRTINLFNYTLKIKLSGDGHLVGKVQNQVILTFYLLNEGEDVLKPNHQYW